MTPPNICRIGIDEAGYGPSLGPLVIASSALAWHSDFEESRLVDLWQHLHPICRKTRKGQTSSLWIYDSKAIKSRSKGLEDLESAALAFFCLNDDWPSTMGVLLQKLGVDQTDFDNLPWYENIWNVKLPVFARQPQSLEQSARLRQALDSNQMHWQGLQARIFNARVFNAGVHDCENKATFHAKNISKLIAFHLHHATAPEEQSFDFRCDKLGGRNQYLGFLKTLFPKTPITIDEQGRKVSRYSLNQDTQRIAIQFQRQADQQNLLTALSSMLCKYLREVFVAELNSYFQKQLPGLKKTAGYPQDAKRFLADIKTLEFAKTDLIRCR